MISKPTLTIELLNISAILVIPVSCGEGHIDQVRDSFSVKIGARDFMRLAHHNRIRRKRPGMFHRILCRS